MATNNRVVIVGAGHNGLVAAGYLARAGLDVQVLERRNVVGGAAVTEEWFPGYRLSSCSFICHLLQKKVIEDLELRRYGFHVYPIDPYSFIPYPDGTYIRVWKDDNRTAEEIRKISPHDADAWLEWEHFWSRAARIMSEFLLTPPPTLSQLANKARDLGDEELLETLLLVPLKDLIERYFESEPIRAAVCAAGDQGDITAAGSALWSAYARVGIEGDNSENYGIVRGGMGGITQSMAHSAEAHGVSIRTNAEVKRILTENGRVTGVELADGEVLSSDTVISNADPKRTFLKLIDSSSLDADFLSDIRAIKTNVGWLKFHAALRELPDFSAYLGTEFDQTQVAQTRICPSVAYYESSWNDARNGQPTRTPILNIQIPSVHDRTVAPEGHHVMSFSVSYQPPHLKDGSWDDVKQAVGEQLIDEVSRYAPNLRDAIIEWTVFTPEDIEDRIGLTDGNIRHIDMVPQQMLDRRPLPGWSDYRTPIQGLYLCGAGTHPGGEVTGAPGHNAAHVLLKELGLGGT